MVACKFCGADIKAFDTSILNRISLAAITLLGLILAFQLLHTTTVGSALSDVYGMVCCTGPLLLAGAFVYFATRGKRECPKCHAQLN